MSRWLLPLFLATALVLAACGGDGDEANAAGPDDLAAPDLPALPSATERVFAVDLPGGSRVEFEFIWIEPGTFLMGSLESEAGRELDEGPRREVTISRGFWMGKYEITQAQWEAVDGTYPWSGRAYVVEDPRCPASYVTWEDVQRFVAKLNAAQGAAVYRLPTEAEWEYACRAGSTTAWYFGDDVALLGEYAWYKYNAWDLGEQYAHPVGLKRPNAWGLYDMHGNVWEWVQDWFSETWYTDGPTVDPQGPATGTMRIRRGADFHYYPEGMRSARRGRSEPLFSNTILGARLVREP